jgi:hypothetical protein
MAFTYNLATNRGKVRLELGDHVFDEGIQPNGDNFDDAELDYFLESEGDHVMRAVAAACENLARQWARQPDSSLGPHSESAGQISMAYEERARKLRSRYGYGNSTASFVVAVGTVPSNPADTSGDYSV